MKDSQQQYRILVLDLDGTLTNNQKEISTTTERVLMAAQQQGIKIVLASGRPVYGIAPLADQLRLSEHDGYVLAYNGGQIFRWSDRQVIYENMLDLEILPYFYQCAKQGGFEILSYDGDDVICENPDNRYVEYECFLNKMRCRKVPHFLEAIHHVVPKCLIVGEPEKLVLLEAEMSEKLRDRYGVYRSEAFFLELVPKGIDKAQCLSVLLQHLGLSREEMIACGDGYNDLSMIKYAGLGVAMSNAKEEVKAAADYITTSNEEDGVARVVEKYCLLP